MPAASFTITGGGITAYKSAVIQSPVTVGTPQSWNVASGKVLTVDGGVHNVISTLTIGGGGNTTIRGVIDDGGYINALGAAGGGLVKSGTGTLTLTAANTRSGPTTVYGGTLTLAGSLSGGTLTVDTSGTFLLAATGRLSAPTQYVGSHGAGTFVQNGGTNTPAKLYLGCGTGSKGAYSLSATGQLSAGYEYLGCSGTGSFGQTGGANSVSSYLYLGYGAGAVGKYTLGGTGSLAACPSTSATGARGLLPKMPAATA